MEVPQINLKTGITSDYWNEYFSKTIILERGLLELAEWIKKYPIKKYEERFPRESSKNLITPQNQARVKRLNELSDLVNNEFTDVSKLTELRFKKVINEFYKSIYGEDKDFYPEAEEDKK
jgi:hypothetical protein